MYDTHFMLHGAEKAMPQLGLIQADLPPSRVVAEL
jgi:hypothetical protein